MHIQSWKYSDQEPVKQRERAEGAGERKEREIDFVNKVEGIEEEIVSWAGLVSEYEEGYTVGERSSLLYFLKATMYRGLT